MATKTTQEAVSMFAIINQSNAFDAVKDERFSTAEEAEARATALLQENPKQVLFTVKMLKKFEAKVQVSGSDL